MCIYVHIHVNAQTWIFTYTYIYLHWLHCWGRATIRATTSDRHQKQHMCCCLGSDIFAYYRRHASSAVSASLSNFGSMPVTCAIVYLVAAVVEKVASSAASASFL